MCKKGGLSLVFISAVLVALTVCGSVWDYEIAKHLYLGDMPSENLFGIIFSYIGVIPTFVGWSFIGASILCLAKKYAASIKQRRALIALAVLLFTLSFFFFPNTLFMVNAGAFSVHWALAYSVGITTIGAAAILGYKLSKKVGSAQLLKKLLFLSAVTIVVMIIISSTKGIMDRPRFRFVLAAENSDYFRNWWQSGSDIKNSINFEAVSDDFSSFPSGHSAYSMLAVFLFPALSDFLPKLGRHKALLSVLGFIWWALTAFSRLTVGAHYLSDVCIAGLVSVLVYVLVGFVNKKISKKTNSHP